MGGHPLVVNVSERRMSSLRGKNVFLPNGRRLGIVHDTVTDLDAWRCSHLFVKEIDPALVEDGIPLAIPWRWVRSVGDIILLRWFPPTQIPRDPQV